MAERTWDILDHETLQVEKGVPEKEVIRRARQGRLRLEDCIRPSGSEEWHRVEGIRKLAELIRKAHGASKAVEAPQPTTPPPAPPAPKPAKRTRSERPKAVPKEAPEEGPLQFRAPRIADVPVDLTPMVDVTFQLLLFFMLTATFTLQKSIEMPNPAEEQGTVTLQQMLRDTIVVEIEGRNVFWVDDQKVDGDELAGRLAQIRRRQNKTSVLIIGHENAWHESTVMAIDAAQEAGIENLILGPPKRAPKTRAFFRRGRRRG